MTTATHNYGWLMPDPGGSANTWGNTLNGTTQAIDNQVAVLGNQVQPNALVVSRGPDGGNYGIIDFLNYGGTQARWQMGVTSDTESGGGNTGSNFLLKAIDNSGNYLGNVFEVIRSTQDVTFSQSLSVNGNITGANGLVVAQAKAGGNSVFEMTNNAGANMGYLGWNAANNSITLANTNGNGTISINTDGSANMSSTLNVGGGMFVYGGTIYNRAQSGGNSNYYFMRNDGAVMGVAYYSMVNSTLILQNQAGGGEITLDGAASLIINGQAFKPGGGVWGATSDARIKTVTGDYLPGLDEVLKLRPVIYRYKGNDAPPKQPSPTNLVEGRQFVGFVAQELERVMPDMVSKRTGYVDGKKVTDLRDVDVSALLFALVNSVKDLKAEIDELKAAK